MYNEDTRMNGGGMPGGPGANPFGQAPIVIDGGYKSNNRNLNVQPTTTVFDTMDEGIGAENKIKYPASEPRPFSKI